MWWHPYLLIEFVLFVSAGTASLERSSGYVFLIFLHEQVWLYTWKIGGYIYIYIEYKKTPCLVLLIKSILRLINDLVTSCVFVTGGTGRAAGFSQGSRYQVGKKEENLYDYTLVWKKTGQLIFK